MKAEQTLVLQVCVKADFLSLQKSLAYSLRIFEDNFSLLSQGGSKHGRRTIRNFL